MRAMGVLNRLGLGSWRFFLAFLVAISHLWGGMIHGPAAYAVWGFFVLSGYLMTYVLRSKYGSTREGLMDYAFNRFLRIFPAYWLACLLGVFVLLIFPRCGIRASDINPEFIFPSGILAWLSNVTLLPVFGLGGGRLVPVSGALSVEVGVYLLIPLMAFSRGAAWLGLILSFALNYQYGLSDNFPIRYSSFLTCFVAFAVGSLICHYQVFLSRWKSRLWSVSLWLGHCLVWIWYDSWPWTYGLYLSLLLSAWVVLSLAKTDTGKIDAWLGDLSYPIYLFHTNIAILFFPWYSGKRTFEFFFVSFLATIVVSVFVVLFIDRKLGGYKRRLCKP